MIGRKRSRLTGRAPHGTAGTLAVGGSARRRVAVLVALIGLAAVSLAVGAQGAYAAGPMGIGGFNVSSSGVVPPRSSIDALAAAGAGAGWVRIEFNTAPFGGTDSPAFYAAYDQLINMYRADGIQVLGLVDYETRPGVSQAAWQANPKLRLVRL